MGTFYTHVTDLPENAACTCAHNTGRAETGSGWQCLDPAVGAVFLYVSLSLSLIEEIDTF